MKTLQKTYTGKYAPNHLEFDYWIDLTADAKGSVIKTYNGVGWTEISGDPGNAGGSSGAAVDAYTKAEVDKKINAVTAQQEVLTTKVNTTEATATIAKETADDAAALAELTSESIDQLQLKNTPSFTAYYDVASTAADTTLFNNAAGNWGNSVRVFIDDVEVNLMDYWDSEAKCFANVFSTTGIHKVTVYTLSKIIVAAIWQNNSHLKKVDFSNADPNLLYLWQSTFGWSGVTEVIFPNGFYFQDNAAQTFAQTINLHVLDVSNFNKSKLVDFQFLNNSIVSTLIANGLTKHPAPLPSMSVQTIIMQDCDFSEQDFNLFYNAGGMGSLDKIDLSRSKIKLVNGSFGTLPYMSNLILDDVNFTSSNLTAGTPLYFGNFCGVLDLSKCMFNAYDPFFTIRNSGGLISASKCKKLILDGMRINVTGSAPILYPSSANPPYTDLSLRNATIISNSISGGLGTLFMGCGNVDLSNATIEGNVNGIDNANGKTCLDDVNFDNCELIMNGYTFVTKRVLDLSTAYGKISNVPDRGFHTFNEGTIYYDSSKLDITAVVENFTKYSPGWKLVDVKACATPWALSQLYDDLNRCTTVDTTTDIPTEYGTVIATVSSDDTYSLSSMPLAGRQVHVVVNNVGDTDVIITMPTTDQYVNTASDRVTVPANGCVKINAISDGTNIYLNYTGSINTIVSRSLISILRNGIYDSDMSSAINDLEKLLGVPSSRTLISISALYSGGNVPVGTAVDNLKDLIVTAHYSDGTKEDITNYTIFGEIAKGDNTVTVEYQGKTATFVVVGISVELIDVALGATVSFESSNGLSISNRADRATALPIGQYLTKGKTYNFSLGEFSDGYYYYGIQIMVASTKGLVFEVDDVEGIQYFSEVSSRELDSGWLTNDYQYTAEQDNRILCVNFKNNASSNLSETDRINLVNNFKIEEV